MRSAGAPGTQKTASDKSAANLMYMGRGRGQASGAGSARPRMSAVDAGTPGKSARARETYKLLEACGLDRQWLLTDLESDTVMAADKVDSFTLVHNAIMSWVVAAYPGHEGYEPLLERWRDDIAFVLMLDGDHKADHIFFYQDTERDGYWTVGMGQAARSYYGLPSDENGGLVAEGLERHLRGSMLRPEDCFSSRLMETPTAVLGYCAERDLGDGSDVVVDPTAIPAGARAVIEPIESLPLEERLAISALADLTKDVGLDEQALSDLYIAAAWAAPYGAPSGAGREYGADRISSEQAARVRDLLGELEPAPDQETGLPVISPTSEPGKLLADARRAWMASRYCDLVSDQQRLAYGADDDARWLDRTRVLCARTGFSTRKGRELLAPSAKRQEARLRGVIGFLAGRQIRADKSLGRQLRAS